MSPQVAIVQDIYAAYVRGDIASILNQLAADVVWEVEGPPSLSFTGIRRGVQETTGFFEALGRDYSDHSIAMTDFVASGDAVVAFGRYEATAKATGKRASTPLAHYWTFRNGKVARYVNYLDTAAFVEAQRP